MNPEKILLEARSVSKRFPAVLALDKVDLRVVAGKVNALVGENGAGKSTLMNILSGVYSDYEGEVLMDGDVQHFHSVHDAQAKGIAIIHQELNLIPYMNIAENIFLGDEPLTPFGWIDKARMHAEAEALLHRLHLKVDTHTLVYDLRVGEQQLVEIAKALRLHSKVLIMDEPTSSLSESETEVLFRLMAELTASGVGIVYISHKMDEVWRLADFVTILRDGKWVAELPMQGCTTDEIVRLMVGRDRKDFFVKQSHERGAVVMQVDKLSLRELGATGKFLLRDISFDLHRSEVLGIYGLIGAGRTELLETLFGLYPDSSSAQLYIEGEAVQIRHPQDAVAHGLALCPEDRKQEGLVLDMSIKKNTTLASLLQCLSPFNTLHEGKERKWAEHFRERLGIKSYSLEQSAGQLSGGNQQKIVLGKCLMTQPKVLFLDEPTRGIDINAKNEIYRLIDELSSQGMAIVLISSELPEIMAISDRIVTLCQGRITAIFERDEFTEESILKASLPL